MKPLTKKLFLIISSEYSKKSVDYTATSISTTKFLITQGLASTLYGAKGIIDRFRYENHRNRSPKKYKSEDSYLTGFCVWLIKYRSVHPLATNRESEKFKKLISIIKSAVLSVQENDL